MHLRRTAHNRVHDAGDHQPPARAIACRAILPVRPRRLGWDLSGLRPALAALARSAAVLARPTCHRPRHIRASPRLVATGVAAALASLAPAPAGATRLDVFGPRRRRASRKGSLGKQGWRTVSADLTYPPLYSPAAKPGMSLPVLLEHNVEAYHAPASYKAPRGGRRLAGPPRTHRKVALSPVAFARTRPLPSRVWITGGPPPSSTRPVVCQRRLERLPARALGLCRGRVEPQHGHVLRGRASLLRPD